MDGRGGAGIFVRKDFFFGKNQGKRLKKISVPISDGLTLLHFGFNHEQFTPPPLRETTQKLLPL
jgi:hypothetical protein